MTTTRFELSGFVKLTPSYGSPSGMLDGVAPIDETEQLSRTLVGRYSLTVDTAVSVAFGPITNAKVVILRSSAKIKARVTSADGSTQSAPVDPLLCLISKSVPVTAVDLTRVAGVATDVEVFLGE